MRTSADPMEATTFTRMHTGFNQYLETVGEVLRFKHGHIDISSSDPTIAAEDLTNHISQYGSTTVRVKRHAVILDSVTFWEGQYYVEIRDPWGISGPGSSTTGSEYEMRVVEFLDQLRSGTFQFTYAYQASIE